MDLHAYLESRRQLIESKLTELVPDHPSPYHKLFEAARYSLLGGGKRIRPLLTLATAEAFNTPVEHALVPACTLELIHTYSLIHDDLPCMDNDDFRRGKPSLHKAYNEGHAVLTGDYLLTHAFEILSGAPHLTAEQKLKLVHSLARASGGHGMIAGQVIDIESVGRKLDLDALKQMHLKKTGALITAAFEFGGIIANVKEPTLALLTQSGQKMGLAFQIVDDLLDAENGEDEGKPTYPGLMGVQPAKEAACSLLRDVQKSMQTLQNQDNYLTALLDTLVNRTH
jgi:geranylgeranyl diphosphate synthase type II